MGFSVQTQQNGKAGGVPQNTVSSSSRDGYFRWAGEHRLEAEQLLGSCCTGPLSPGETSPSWAATPRCEWCMNHCVLWTSVTSSWEVQEWAEWFVCAAGGQEAGERLHGSVFSSGFAIAPGEQEKLEDKKLKRWWRASGKSDASFWTGPWLDSTSNPCRLPNNTNSGWIQAAGIRCFSSVLLLLQILKHT